MAITVHQCTLLLFLLRITLGEVYTSQHEMKSLLRTQKEAIRATENYIANQEAKLQQVKMMNKKMKELHDRATEDPLLFINNPINCYFLVKKLTVDWNILKNYMADGAVEHPSLENLTWPGEEDLEGLTTALIRIQSVYLLETRLMAKGIIKDLAPAYREFTADECYSLGRKSYQLDDYGLTVQWMTEAMNRLNVDITDSNEVVKAEILEYLILPNYIQGLHQALKFTKELLALRPHHIKAISDDFVFQEVIKKQMELGGDFADKTGRMVQSLQDTPDNKLQAVTERICRGEFHQDQEKRAKLSCFYKFGPNPYLRIVPFKTEVVNIDPFIYIYYEVLSDSEIQLIKDLVSSKMVRNKIQSMETGEGVIQNSRISKGGDLRDDEHSTVDKLTKRINAITGLNMSTAEVLHVTVYGTAGFIKLHYDHSLRDVKLPFNRYGGNRIATFFLYLSDVTHGGATAFPYLETAIQPVRGSAAFWYNLLPSGEGDPWTLHSGCPIVSGEKWVANKWIFEYGQEFIRPCTLNCEDRF